MTSLEYAADAARLARAIEPLWDTIPYLEPSDPNGVYVVEVQIKAQRLREIVAVQQALQLALDAAQLAVLYRDFELEIPEVAAAILDMPDVVYDVIWVGPGSVRIAFTVNPLTERGRTWIRLLFYFGLGALALMPGGAFLAFAYGGALEVLMMTGQLAQDDWESKQNVPVQTVDADALRETRVQVAITPPDKSWVAPGDRLDRGRE
ncbi:hypothetical protein [Agromyces humatus]|uniref:Uncharacterized protein n=1 Tax=Agromyces humatus TaxID=279573 RepID=A0ABP4WTR3_9MICO|nr:hypothetical protein [Agromyces humatus]